MLVELLVGIILFALIIWNRVVVYKSKRHRDSMCRLNNRRVMLGLTPARADLANDLFLDQSALKMHNTGTDLERETDSVEFVANADVADFLESLGYRMRENLEKLINKIWDIASQGARMMKDECNEIIYNKKSKEHFGDIFEELYMYIANEYMQCPDEPLDRHKVAAITMISIIKAGVVTSDYKDEDNIFFGNYTLAADSGLQYMLSELNKRLLEKKMKQVERYYFPVAMACETDYYRIFIGICFLRIKMKSGI